MKNSTKALLLGLLSAVFFSSTYIFNKSMVMSGGDFLWSASLRYILTLPMIMLIALLSKGGKTLIKELWRNPFPWFLWGTIGFGFFYLFLTAAAAFSPAWLVAGTFQTTIIAGLLISPFIYTDHRKNIPRKALAATFIILLGIIFSQYAEVNSTSYSPLILGAILIVISATLFPLGNRKIMLYQEKERVKLNAIQRVAGMTIGSMPLWIIVSLFAYERSGPPSSDLLFQSGMVALFSGIIATILFFKATSMVNDQPTALGAVEATQSFEIIITLIIEILFLNGTIPTPYGLAGIALIVIGMVYYSKASSITEKEKSLFSDN
jgi:drug/metabolite transporter (DMT)-like permease